MKIIVTGANGQLGRELVPILRTRHEVFGLGRNELDVKDLDLCRSIMRRIKPDAVIHAAAYTAVDLAETNEDEAYAVNAFGSRNIALGAADVGAKVCYISSDYVFDGTARSPYKEFDTPNPVNVYGKSKRAGELLVQTIAAKWFIVRTSWVYGVYGSNFVKTMLRQAARNSELKVVHDQIGSPTYAKDLSHFLMQLVETDKYGIYHATNTGHCSWYEFAEAIFEESGLSVRLQPCTSAEFPRPAVRPQYSVLDHMSIRTNGFDDLRNWREALKDCLSELKMLS